MCAYTHICIKMCPYWNPSCFLQQAIKFATDSISVERKPWCRTNPCGIADQKKKEVKSRKERQTSLRILFFSSSKSRKGKMERIKRAAEKRRAWLEVSTNNVYFIHPSLLTSLFPRNPYPFRTRPQWPISKVDRKRGSAALFFFYTASRHLCICSSL